MALMRRGVTDLNTEDPELLERAIADLQELNDKVGREGHDLRLRDAAGRAHVAAPGVVGRPDQRGHLLPAEGRQPDVLSYWYQKQGGPIFNDCIGVAPTRRSR